MYYDDPPQGSGCARGGLLIALAIVAVAGFFYYQVNSTANAIANPFRGTITNPLAPQPTVISVDRPAIVQSIKSANKLVTTTYIAEKVIQAGQHGSTFYNLFLGDSLLLVANGEVLAGVDLSKLKDEDVVISNDGVTVTLTLPPTEVLSYKLDNEKTYVADRNSGIATRGNPGLETEARRVAEIEILRNACNGGVLERAATDGQRDLELLLKGLGFKQIKVNAQAGQCTLPGGAPLPPAPTAQPATNAP